MDGGRFKSVKWGNKQSGKLPKDFPTDFKGAVAIVVMSRWSEKKPDFGIERIFVVQPPLEENDTEESP